MSGSKAALPPVHGLFLQRFDGDDALLRLARLRFDQAGLAAEVYGGTPAELNRVLDFAPSRPHLPVVHLDRGLNLLRPADLAAVQDFADRFAGRVGGLVVHDRSEMAARTDELVRALSALGSHLDSIANGPWLYLEYAAGLDIDWFAGVAQRLRDVQRVSLCVDIGHVGVSQSRRSFRRLHPHLDVVALQPGDGRLPELAGDVQTAVATALPTVLELITSLGETGKPTHFHIHDGHPLVPGLADHFSFLTVLPIPFPYQDGRLSLRPMYGPNGLAAILRRAAQSIGVDRASFTLEIHQAEGRLPLAEAAGLFRHWRDTTNAERTNYWLSVLTENAVLVTSNFEPSSAP